MFNISILGVGGLPKDIRHDPARNVVQLCMCLLTFSFSVEIILACSTADNFAKSLNARHRQNQTYRVIAKITMLILQQHTLAFQSRVAHHEAHACSVGPTPEEVRGCRKSGLDRVCRQATSEGSMCRLQVWALPPHPPREREKLFGYVLERREQRRKQKELRRAMKDSWLDWGFFSAPLWRNSDLLRRPGCGGCSAAVAARRRALAVLGAFHHVLLLPGAYRGGIILLAFGVML